MALSIIPTPTENQPLALQRTSLDGRDYLLTFDWNGRESRWYLRIEDVDGNGIISGIKLVANWPLLKTNASDERPPGELILSTPDGQDPSTLDGLQNAKLLYVSESELAAL